MWVAREGSSMATEDVERTSVRTYVPAYQKEEWTAHADELEMSLSEYVRTMVQAGKRGFDGVDEPAEDPSPEEPGPGDATPGVDGLESSVLEALDNGPREFDEIVDVVADDFRRDVDEVLGRLEDQDRVEHDRLEGGYRVTDDG